MKLLTPRTIIKNIIMTMVIVSLSIGSFSNIVVAEVMTSGSYKLQSDSVNFAGGRSTSGSYGVEDTAGEISTGNSQSTNYGLSAGYQQTEGGAFVSPTPTPSTSGGPSSGSIPKPTPQIVMGSYVVPNVLNFQATAHKENTTIDLTWNNPLDFDFNAIVLVKNSKFFPSNPEDGEIVFLGKDNQYLDKDVEEGVNYYYAIFVRDNEGRYSSGALAFGRITKPGEIVTGDVFGEVPLATKLDPIIAALTLKDFDFIQDGRKIDNNGVTIPIDGSRNLTIILDYNKVPEILKTIAFSLKDPEDPTKVFPFLLRVNKSKTAYEATIAPLGRDGDYKIDVVILDYKNQGLLKLNGNLKAFVFESVNGILSNGEINKGLWSWLWLLILLVLAMIAYQIFKRKHQNEYQ